MKKIQVFKLLIIFLYFNYSKASICSETFDEYMKEMCEYIREDSSHFCEYSNGICNSKPNTCDLYLGKDESVCKAIILPDPYKKCSIINNKCTETKKICNDYETDKEIDCESLEAGDSKRCILNNGICEAHFSQCGNFSSGAYKTKCEANIPINSNHKCIWEDNSCKEVEKECQDYNKNCEDITPLDKNKICITYESGCKEQYKSCQLYNLYETSKNKLDCENTKIYIETKQNFDDSQLCVFSEGKCLTRDKQCSDIFEESECNRFIPKGLNKACEFVDNQCTEKYKSYKLSNEKVANKNKEDREPIYLSSFYGGINGGRRKESERGCSDMESEYSCKHFTPTDTNKNCAYINNICIEQYESCGIYNRKSLSKNKEECESIILYDGFDKSESTYKCVFKEGSCLTTNKICSEMISEVGCNNYILEEKNKKCIFIDGQCVEQFKTCEHYDNETIKSKEVCESILPYTLDDYYPYLDQFSKCVFENGHCVRKRQDCSKVKKYYCSYAELIGENTMCAFENGECKEVYKSCDSYNLAPDKNEEGCKAVTVYYSDKSVKYINYKKKCVYENNKCVEKEIKNCEDYEPWLDEKYCTLITFGDYKRCFLQDGQCVLKYTGCPGNREIVSNDICRSIEIISCSHYGSYSFNNITFDTYDNCYIYEGSKCFIENGKCIEERCDMTYRTYDECVMSLFGCKNAATYEECASIIPALGRKCIYENNECKEQFTDCLSYEEYGERPLNKSICESIVLNNTYSSKCVFSKGRYWDKCEEQKILCSDIKSENFMDFCYQITPSSLGKKCVYSSDNNSCEEVDKYCLELRDESSVNESICANAITSSYEICSLKADNSGCELKEKPINNDGFIIRNKFIMLIIISLLLK